MSNQIASAFETLKQAMNDDAGYAWSWQCNLAMSYYDEGATHEQANKAASRFMRLAFDIDITKHPEWKEFERLWASPSE